MSDADAVRLAISVLTCYGGDPGPRPTETMTRVLVAVDALREQRAAEERAHARRRDDPLRLADMARVVDIVRERGSRLS